MSTHHIPAGLAGVVPFLSVDGGPQAISFYQEAFGAELVSRFDGPGGTVAHAQLRIGGTVIELGDPFPDSGQAGPEAGGPHSVVLTHWCPDADAVHARAVRAGARSLSEPEDGFTGDRMGRLIDPFGHRWVVATHVEDVPPEELTRRVAALIGE